MRFGIVRSYANSLVAAEVGQHAQQPHLAHGGRRPLLRREGDILSFRSLYLDVGEIDVQTDGECY